MSWSRFYRVAAVRLPHLPGGASTNRKPAGDGPIRGQHLPGPEAVADTRPGVWLEPWGGTRWQPGHTCRGPHNTVFVQNCTVVFVQNCTFVFVQNYICICTQLFPTMVSSEPCTVVCLVRLQDIRKRLIFSDGSDSDLFIGPNHWQCNVVSYIREAMSEIAAFWWFYHWVKLKDRIQKTEDGRKKPVSRICLDSCRFFIVLSWCQESGLGGRK